MTRRILVRSGKEPWVRISPEASLEANVLGTNSGNALFSTGVFAALSVESNELSSDYFQIDRVDHTDRVAAAVEEDYDHLVIPMANAFRPSFLPSLERWSRLIERLTIPVTVVGIGAQMNLDRSKGDADEAVNRAAKRFMSAVLDRGTSVGVRGERTAAYLENLGFGDSVVDVIGCPSLYRPDIDVRMRKKSDVLDSESRVVLALTPGLANAPQLNRRLGSWITANLDERTSVEYVAQENQDLRHLLWASGLTAESPRDLPRHPDHPLLTSGRSRMFVDESSWRRHLSDVDFVVGNRIHGVVAGVLAGVPSMALPFDSRISELAEYHRLPHRPLRTIEASDTASVLFDAVDVEPFNAQHQTNVRAYCDFLERHGLAHAFTPAARGGTFGDRMSSFDPPAGLVPVTAGRESDPILDRLEYLRRLSVGPAKSSVARLYPAWARPVATPSREVVAIQQQLEELHQARSQFQEDRRRAYAGVRRRAASLIQRIRQR